MKLALNLTSNSFIDFAIGTVIKGKEAQVFQEYSPAIGPVLKDLEIKSLRPFAVLATNLNGTKPEQGALTRFKKVENYNEFLKDPRFLKVKPLRDDGMIFLNDGNMFEATEQSIELDSDNDYAFVLSSQQEIQDTAIFQMKIAENSPNEFFKGKSLSLYNWSNETEKLMEQDSATVLHIRFFPEQK